MAATFYAGVAAAAAAMYVLAHRKKDGPRPEIWDAEAGYDDRSSARPMRAWLGSRFTPSPLSPEEELALTRKSSRPRTGGSGAASDAKEAEILAAERLEGRSIFNHPAGDDDALGTGAEGWVEEKRGGRRVV